MSRFTCTSLPLSSLVRVQHQPLADARGFFERLFCAEELTACGWTHPIAQINRSLTHERGSVRGLHYQQPPHAEMKLVTCLRGAVWDVAVDLRAGSPTFLHWHAEELRADNACALLIPEGFAHGFQALTPDAELLYCHSHPYTPAAEAGLHPLDARLAIPWPLPVARLSPRDAALPEVAWGFVGLT
ncbi:MAG: dTDP-4-dehydrorhamnose 3,5-epimerase [Comamonas sp.]|nr:dTDP-4-dehydrorhamnose 3,5-epimerase [Comamonas sp.]